MRFSSCEMLGENGTLTGTTCIKHYFRFNLHPYIHWYEIRLQIVTETAALQVAPPGPSLESLQWWQPPPLKFYCTLKNILNKLLIWRGLSRRGESLDKFCQQIFLNSTIWNLPGPELELTWYHGNPVCIGVPSVSSNLGLLTKGFHDLLLII